MAALLPSKSQSWARYWAVSGDMGAACLPGAPDSVSHMLENKWREYFRALSKGAALLDLGTGGGAVLRQALGVRSDLDLTGVDYAVSLPDAPKGIQLMAGVSLEALPFNDNSYDSVTSQFAIEYADVDVAASELGRVLKPNGTVMIVTHHADSIIRSHNDRRRAALEDLLAPEGLLPTALEIKRAGTEREKESLVKLDSILRTAQGTHGKQGVVMEVLSLLAPMLVAPEGIASLEMLAQDMQMEVARLSALSSAALDDKAANSLVTAVSAYADVRLTALEVDGVDQPIAWCIA